jgi:hypothetical protein
LSLRIALELACCIFLPEVSDACHFKKRANSDPKTAMTLEDAEKEREYPTVNLSEFPPKTSKGADGRAVTRRVRRLRFAVPVRRL